MVEFASLPQAAGPKRLAVYAAIVALGGTLGGYAIHEHHTAQNLAADNVQTTAALNATQHQLSDLTAKVNMLASRSEAQATPSTPSAPQSAQTAAGRPSAAHRQKVDRAIRSCNRNSTHRARPLSKRRATSPIRVPS